MNPSWQLCKWNKLLLSRRQWWEYPSANNARQVLVYGCLWSNATQIIKNGRKKIVDAPLTSSFKMGHRGYHFLLFLQRRPIIPWWLSEIYCLADYQQCMTTNCWHSVENRFLDGVGSVLQYVLPRQEANTSIMHNHDEINFQIPDLHDQKMLMLCWHSFCHRCIRNVQLFESALDITHIVLAAFQVFSFTCPLITTLFFNNPNEYIL